MKINTTSITTVLKLFTAAGRNWGRDNIPSMAASLAFHALLSLAPLLIFMVSVFGLLIRADVIERQIIAQVESSFGAQAAEGIRIVLANAAVDKPHAIVVSSGTLLMLLIFSAGFFRQLIHALNVVWRVSDGGGESIFNSAKRLIRGHFLAVVMVLCIGLYLYASVLVNAMKVLPGDALMQAFPALEYLLPQIPRLVFPLILFFLFMGLFQILPARKIAWGDVWPGALIAAVLFIVCYRLIALYLQRAALTSYYGAAGSFIILLLWIYWSTMIFLFGAEVAKAYADRHGSLRPGERAR